jgi:predicted ATP-grasp superfamily ATP-dependent carboligase
MPTVFVYEYCCALGLGRDPSDPAHSLYREGRAMRDAVAEDFRRVPGVELLTLDGLGRDTEDQVIQTTARRADFTLLIAPETDGILEQRYRWAHDTPTRLLVSGLWAIRTCQWKGGTFDVWAASGVPTPELYELDEWPGDHFPAVLKPGDGAGSTDTWLIRGPRDRRRVRAAARDPNKEDYVVQDFVPGRAASVAFLIGPAQTVPLLPTFQLLSSDGRFRYEGGELPIPPDLTERAVALGERAIRCVPGLLGYVGVDLVLGDSADGSDDFAIEINPRLTTSYVGLRAVADFNIAEAVLRIVNGEPVEPRWKPGRVQFRPDGAVSVDPTPGPAFG